MRNTLSAMTFDSSVTSDVGVFTVDREPDEDDPVPPPPAVVLNDTSGILIVPPGRSDSASSRESRREIIAQDMDDEDDLVEIVASVEIDCVYATEGTPRAVSGHIPDTSIDTNVVDDASSVRYEQDLHLSLLGPEVSLPSDVGSLPSLPTSERRPVNTVVTENHVHDDRSVISVAETYVWYGSGSVQQHDRRTLLIFWLISATVFCGVCFLVVLVGGSIMIYHTKSMHQQEQALARQEIWALQQQSQEETRALRQALQELSNMVVGGTRPDSPVDEIRAAWKFDQDTNVPFPKAASPNFPTFAIPADAGKMAVESEEPAIPRPSLASTSLPRQTGSSAKPAKVDPPPSFLGAGFPYVTDEKNRRQEDKQPQTKDQKESCSSSDDRQFVVDNCWIQAQAQVELGKCADEARKQVRHHVKNWQHKIHDKSRAIWRDVEHRVQDFVKTASHSLDEKFSFDDVAGGFNRGNVMRSASKTKQTSSQQESSANDDETVKSTEKPQKNGKSLLESLSNPSNTLVWATITAALTAAVIAGADAAAKHLAGSQTDASTDWEIFP
jgi:hypothetical protein